MQPPCCPCCGSKGWGKGQLSSSLTQMRLTAGGDQPPSTRCIRTLSLIEVPGPHSLSDPRPSLPNARLIAFQREQHKYSRPHASPILHSTHLRLLGSSRTADPFPNALTSCPPARSAAHCASYPRTVHVDPDPHLPTATFVACSLDSPKTISNPNSIPLAVKAGNDAGHSPHASLFLTRAWRKRDRQLAGQGDLR